MAKSQSPSPHRLRKICEEDTFSNHIGAAFVDHPEGKVALTLKVAAHHLNMYNTCHGGVIFTLADSAFGVAANAYEHASMAIDAHITYSKAVYEGDTLLATVTELVRTRRTGTYRVDVTVNGGHPVSQFTGTVYISSKPSVS